MFLGKKLNKKTGFTLIEVVIALSILIFVVIFAISFFPVGLKSAVSAGQKTVAVYLAQAKMEEIISTPYADVITGQYVESTLASISQDFTAFSRTTDLTYVDENLDVSLTDTGLIKAQVNVSWLDSKTGNNVSTDLTTLIADL